MWQTVTADLESEPISIAGSVVRNCEFRRDVVFRLDKVKGRINVAVLNRDKVAIIKFDGWPEVSAYFTKTLIYKFMGLLHLVLRV